MEEKDREEDKDECVSGRVLAKGAGSDQRREEKEEEGKGDAMEERRPKKQYRKVAWACRGARPCYVCAVGHLEVAEALRKEGAVVTNAAVATRLCQARTCTCMLAHE